MSSMRMTAKPTYDHHRLPTRGKPGSLLGNRVLAVPEDQASELAQAPEKTCNDGDQIRIIVEESGIASELWDRLWDTQK